jgi:hypothetical protein
MTIRLAGAIFLLAALLPAQSTANSWDAVRALPEGAHVKVMVTSGEMIEGNLVSTTEDGMSIQAAQGEIAVERARVRRVQLRSGSRRVRNALIGVGIGVVFGVLLDQTLGVRLRNEGAGNRAAMYGIPIGLGGALGAAAPGYRTVYRAK